MHSLICDGEYRSLDKHERERRRRLVIWSSCLIMAVFLLAISLAVLNNPKPKTDIHIVSKGANFIKTTVASAAASNGMVTAACKSTLYPAACESALGGSAAKSLNDIFSASVESAKLRASSARALAYNLTVPKSKSKAKTASFGRPTALDDCLELLDISLEQLDDVINSKGKSKQSADDIHTWLSAALTHQVTCSDGMAAAGGDDAVGVKAMSAEVRVLSQYISNALALHAKLKGKAGRGRRLRNEFPDWLTAEDRKLLQASPEDIRPDAVVAADGSGTHRTITEAIESLSLKPDDSDGGGGRSVIYVKAGTYREYIKIPTKQKNVMLMGDGKGKSVIVGSRNSEDGWSTYQSATVAAMGAGFIGKGLTIINDSGPSKHQAVALRVGADHGVVYQCSIQGFQDSLYSYANRQFYRDCDIYGTVDFIFGNSASVFQNCIIQARHPAGGQKNSVTAQGRSDPNQNTGMSFQSCKVSGDSGGAPTYLGRPWKQYSRVVFMESELDGSINKAGWEPWSGGFALKTLYYGEYGNTGSGAGTSGRVNWPGVHPQMSIDEASKFTVANFISGNSWLPATGVDYNGGL